MGPLVFRPELAEMESLINVVTKRILNEVTEIAKKIFKKQDCFSCQVNFQRGFFIRHRDENIRMLGVTCKKESHVTKIFVIKVI